MSKLINLVGHTFGRFTVLKRAKNDKYGQARWVCLCICGNLKEIKRCHLISGMIRSCGCYHDEVARISGKKTRKHGDSHSALYGAWSRLKDRCLNPKNKFYHRYGGRGISVCNEWKNNYLAFKQWALANGYRIGLSIDRIDNNGNYEPNNCQWIPLSENTKKAWREKRNE